MSYNIEDFTEQGYRDLIDLAKKNYKFVRYEEYKTDERAVLWRHDLDYSVHRGLRLAEIEREKNVFSTFFIYIHSSFYNIFEEEIAAKIYSIKNMGHQLALHFDAAFYGERIKSIDNLKYFIEWEKNILEEYLDVKIQAISFHNPDCTIWSSLGDETVHGMVNCYSNAFKESWDYCSDSNGYWRYRRLFDVLSANKAQKLQILTHPVWWVPTPRNPRERILRCIEGRAKKSIEYYDNLLAMYGRKNIN